LAEGDRCDAERRCQRKRGGDECVRDLIAERNRLRVGWAGRSEISIPGLDEVK